MDKKLITVVTPFGEVLQKPKNSQGLLIVDDQDHKPVLRVGEVSDDNVVNLFIDLHHAAGDFINNIHDAQYMIDDPASSHEVLIDRKDLTHDWPMKSTIDAERERRKKGEKPATKRYDLDTIVKAVLNMISKEDFRQWHEDEGAFGNYIMGDGEKKTKKQQEAMKKKIEEDIAKMLRLP